MEGGDAKTAVGHGRWTVALQHALEVVILALFTLAPRSYDGPYAVLPVLTASAVLVAVAAVLATALWLGESTSRSGGASRPFRRVYPALVVLAAVGVAVGYALRGSQRFSEAFPPGIDPISWIATLTILVATRFFRRPAAFGLFLFAAAFSAFGAAYLLHSYPIAHQIRTVYTTDPIMRRFATAPAVLVPGFALSARAVLLWLLPFLAALYCVRAGFRWWQYLAGGAAAYLAVFGILFLRLPIGANEPVLTLLFLATLVLLVRLPLQRRSLERLCAMSFDDREAPLERPARSLLTSIATHGMVLALLAFLALFAVLGHYERRMALAIERGLPPPAHSPALTNAFDALKPYYVKRGLQEPRRKLDTRQGAELALFSQLDRTPPALLDEAAAAVDRPRLEQAIAALQPAIDALAKAAEADYCLFYEKGQRAEIDFARVRVAVLAVTARARLRICERRPAEALGDIETLLRVAWLLNADASGGVIHHGSAERMRGWALSAATDYFLYYRASPAELELLRQFLDRNAPKVHVDWPDATVRRNEPGCGPVSLCFESTMPGIAGAVWHFYRDWAEFDELRIAVALEAWRNDAGSYPATLDALVPQYLSALPREPIEGRTYEYANAGGNVSIGVTTFPAQSSARPFVLQPAPAASDKIRQALEQYRAGRDGAAKEGAQP